MLNTVIKIIIGNSILIKISVLFIRNKRTHFFTKRRHGDIINTRIDTLFGEDDTKCLCNA